MPQNPDFLPLGQAGWLNTYQDEHGGPEAARPQFALLEVSSMMIAQETIRSLKVRNCRISNTDIMDKKYKGRQEVYLFKYLLTKFTTKVRR